jgi:hypothetical protein
VARDGPYDDGARDSELQHRLRRSESEDGTVAARTEPAELRTRAEYYEALRAADGDAGHADERSGWDAIDTENRPAVEALRVTPERLTHILDGDATGGGHRPGTGKPGKTEFPAGWDDGKIIDTLLDVAPTRSAAGAPGVE